MEARIVTVSPQQAARWLEHAANNRRLVEALVIRYARDMTNGKWQVNGQGIIISDKGNLLDGQNRLHACIKAGVSFKSLVVEGVNEDAFQTMDSGKTRTLADVLHISGREYSNELAAAITLIYQHALGTFSGKAYPSHEEGLEVLERYPELPQCVSEALPCKPIVSTSIMAMIRCLGARQFDEDTASLFVESLIDGVNLTKQSPVKLLRDRLLLAKSVRRTGNLTRLTIIAYAIKAFNAFAWGHQLTVLKWVKGEEFPLVGHETKSKLIQRKYKTAQRQRLANGDASHAD